MNRKDQNVSKEALEIIELAIDDLTTLARAFDLIGDLSKRGCQFIEPAQHSNEESLLH